VGVKQQKSQMELAFMGSAEVKPKAVSEEGTETPTAGSKSESQAGNNRLMEEILERENLMEALKRVQRNKGAAGVDGMGVEELTPYLKQHWLKLREQLLSGNYEPKPVRRVEIPKAGGGQRKLGIPTAVDRFIQQAVLQVLQPEWDQSFSEYSYGFRPKRTAHEAIAQAQEALARRQAERQAAARLRQALRMASSGRPGSRPVSMPSTRLRLPITLAASTPARWSAGTRPASTQARGRPSAAGTRPR